VGRNFGWTSEASAGQWLREVNEVQRTTSNVNFWRQSLGQIAEYMQDNNLTYGFMSIMSIFSSSKPLGANGSHNIIPLKNSDSKTARRFFEHYLVVHAIWLPGFYIYRCSNHVSPAVYVGSQDDSPRMELVLPFFLLEDGSEIVGSRLATATRVEPSWC
jgi:hypothetical protein